MEARERQEGFRTERGTIRGSETELQIHLTDERKLFKIVGQRGDVQRTPKDPNLQVLFTL